MYSSGPSHGSAAVATDGQDFEEFKLENFT